MGILIVLLGGLLFLYLNIKCAFKINITFYFLHVYFYVIIFRKNMNIKKESIFPQKIIDRYKAPELRQKTKNNLKYLKHIKKVFNIFYVKDIFFYPECILEKQSFALEFVIVNRMLKKSLLNG